MNAVTLHATGGPEQLQYGPAADPTPTAGEVVVRLAAAALNHRDVWIRKGQYAGITLPIILGSDGAGTVEAVGDGVDAALVGERVVINPGLDWGDDPRCHWPKFRILGLPDPGTYAERVAVPAAAVHAAPAGLTDAEAAALPLAGLTAYRAVVTRAKVTAADVVLVTGIGGGVSLFALQIAKALGATVVVTSGSDDKLATAKAHGADGGVNYKAGDWGKAVTDLTNGGPTVVIDSVAGETLNTAIAIARPGARLVNYGATTGPIPSLEVRRVFWKQLDLLGSTMGSPAEFAALLTLFRERGLKPVVDRVFPLQDAAAAHAHMEAAGQCGKIVLDCR